MDFENTVRTEIQNMINETLQEIIFDGTIYRFGKNKHAWYVAHEYIFKEKKYFTISFGSWKLNTSSTFRSWDNKQIDVCDFTKKIDIDRRIKNETKKHELAIKCSDKWLPIWEHAKEETHDYMKAKGLGWHYGSRITDNGDMVIPMFKPNGFVGVQRIFFDETENGFKKRFSYGVDKTGAFCSIKSIINIDKCYLAEGFATAASVVECMNMPTVVSFDAGNICHCINSIRYINPKIKIMIAADNDKESGTGLRYAKKALSMFKDVSYRIPIFKNDQNGKLSDFNDLHKSEGKQTVYNILKF